MVSRYVKTTVDNVIRTIDLLALYGIPPQTYDAPAQVLATPLSGNKAQVSWTAVENAVAYEVWEAATGTVLATITAPTVTRTSGEIAVGKYIYRVRAVFADGGVSAFTYAPEITVGAVEPGTGTDPIPEPANPAPATVTSSVINTNQVKVDWAAVSGATSYEVWETATTTGPVATIIAPTVTRTSGSLALGSYTYRVRALFPGGGVSDFKVGNTVTVAAGSGGSTDPGTPAPGVPATYPNASTTGVANQSLLPSSATVGNIQTTSAGQVIQNVWITGHIVVNHPGVIIRNSRIIGNNAYAGLIFTANASAEGTLVEDCELGPDGGTQLTSDAFNGKNFNYTMRRCDIHNLTDGTKMGAGTFEDNYIHNIGPRDTAHHDGVQVMGNGGGVTYIRHNTITIGIGQVGAYNATVFLKSDASAIGVVYVDGNYVDGCGYTFKWGGGPFGMVGHVYMRDNRFGHGSPYGQLLTGVPSAQATYSNNAFLDGVGTIKIVGP